MILVLNEMFFHVNLLWDDIRGSVFTHVVAVEKWGYVACIRLASHPLSNYRF